MEIDLTNETTLFDADMPDEEENMEIIEKSPEESPAPESHTFQYFTDSPTVLELCRASWSKTKGTQQRYLRGCAWSPDGTCLCTVVNSAGIQVFELPIDVYPEIEISVNRPVDILQPVIKVPESGTVYDFRWNPLMDSEQPATCFFIASRQNSPIDAYDAFNGRLRCSYRGYDAVDEVEAAISVAFATDGAHIFGGYKKSIKIFDTDVPGRTYQSLPIKSPASCIATNSNSPDLLGVGSWNCSINLLDTRGDDTIKLPDTHKGGITQLKFSYSGQHLFSGARKDKKIIMWDTRTLSSPLYVFERSVNTNQRIEFDLSCENKWLVSGDTSGILRIWDMLDYDETSEKFKETQFPVHNDCCNGISLHPRKTILATASGQHHSTSSLADDDVIDDANLVENALIMWWTGKIKE